MKSSSYTKVSQKKQQLGEDKEDHGEIKEKSLFQKEKNLQFLWHGIEVCILSASDSEREENTVQNCLRRNVIFKRECFITVSKVTNRKKEDIHITFVLRLQKITTLHVAGLLSKTTFLVLYKDFIEDQYVLGELINFHYTHQRSIAMRKKTAWFQTRRHSRLEEQAVETQTQHQNQGKEGIRSSRLGVRSRRYELVFIFILERKSQYQNCNLRKVGLECSRMAKSKLLKE